MFEKTTVSEFEIDFLGIDDTVKILQNFNPNSKCKIFKLFLFCILGAKGTFLPFFRIQRNFVLLTKDIS